MVRSLRVVAFVAVVLLGMLPWRYAQAGGFAGCPGCRLWKNVFGNGLGLVYGTPTSIPPGLETTYLRVTTSNWQTTWQLIAPPTAPNQYYGYWVQVPQNTVSAAVDWYYWIAGVNLYESTPLIVD